MCSAFLMRTRSGSRAAASSSSSPIARSRPPAFTQSATSARRFAIARRPPGPTARTRSGVSVSPSERPRGDPRGPEMGEALRIAGVDHVPPRGRLPARRVSDEVSHQGVRRGVGLGAAGHVELAEQDHAPAFAVLQQRAVLEAEPAVDDRQEVAAGGLLDQDRGDVPPIAAPPDAGHADAAPQDRRPVARPQLVVEARRQDRRLAPPVGQVLRGEARQDRVVGDAREDLPQPVLRDAEAEPPLQHGRRLLEDDHLQAVADPVDPRRRAVDRQGGLAHDEHVESGEIRVRRDRLEADAQRFQERGRLALRVEQGDPRHPARRGAGAGGRTSIAKVSSCVSPVPNRTVALSS